MPTIPTITLNDGTDVPRIGLGTYNLRGDDGIAAIVAAIESGYRLLDTAVNYENEREVGEAVRRSGARTATSCWSPRKIPGRHHGYDDAIASVEASLRRLGLDHLDLHLIHWPNPSVGKYVEAWRAHGRPARARGWSARSASRTSPRRMLDRLIDETGVTPAVNQVELHPYFPQGAMRAVHDELGIRTESWSPLGKRAARCSPSRLVDRRRPSAHGVTPGQVVLRWHVQLGSTPIPKSATPSVSARTPTSSASR